MTEVAFSSSFKRAFKRRIKGDAVLETRFWERLEETLDFRAGRMAERLNDFLGLGKR